MTDTENLDKLVLGLDRLRDAVSQSIGKSGTCWHRLNIKVTSGNISTVHIVRDEDLSETPTG
jgi:hypothetical protein